MRRLPDAEQSRNVILGDDVVARVVAAARQLDLSYGLYLEVAAVTGSRPSQLLRVEVRDLLDDGPAPRLLVPSSRKGRRRKTERKPIPIPVGLAAKLREAATGRPEDAPLLVRGDGTAWRKLGDWFSKAAARAGLDPAITQYSLRHSSIVRALLANVVTRVVASLHDTSVAMIEKTYSKHIVGDPSDAMVRRALLDLGEPAPADNVVTLSPTSSRKR
jgi:integrase